MDFFDESGEPWEHCPRGKAKKAIKDLQEQEDLSLKIGFEVEFAIFNLQYEGVENNCYANSNSLDAYSKILEDVCDTLEALEIEVLAVHKETGPG